MIFCRRLSEQDLANIEYYNANVFLRRTGSSPFKRVSRREKIRRARLHRAIGEMMRGWVDQS